MFYMVTFAPKNIVASVKDLAWRHVKTIDFIQHNVNWILLVALIFRNIYENQFRFIYHPQNTAFWMLDPKTV